jgi:ATP-dependent DNA helicase RecG
VISNPGGLPNDLNPEEFGTRSVARNPLISSLLHRCNYIEEAGTGIQRMQAGMKEAGLSKPIFKFSSFFTVTLKRCIKNEAYLNSLIPVGKDRLERMYAVLRQLHEEECLEIESIAKQFNTSSRSIRRDLEMLETFDLVISSGATKDKSYSLTDEALDRMYS